MDSSYSQSAEASGCFPYTHAEFPTCLFDIIILENGLSRLLATSKQLCAYACVCIVTTCVYIVVIMLIFFPSIIFTFLFY